MYSGYLSGCTVFLDMDGGGVQNSGEPSATTTPFGRFGLTVRRADLLSLSSMHVIVKPGTGCVDTSTGLPLAFRMKVAAPCGAILNAVGMVNLITAVQTKVTSADPAATISTGLALTAFDACSYDPLAYAWTADTGTQEQSTFQNFVQVNLEVVTVVKALADVTGYANDAAYAAASDAILQGIADDFEAFAAAGSAGVITFSTAEITKELAQGAASAADSADVLSDALLTDVAASTASLVGVLTDEVDGILEEVTAAQEGAADGNLAGLTAALESLAKASVVSQNATTEAAALLKGGATSAEIEQSLEANTAKDVVISEIAEADVPPAFQAPSPHPPPPPSTPTESPVVTLTPPPPPAPPSSPPLQPFDKTGGDDAITTEDEDTSMYGLFALIVLIFPLIFCVYVVATYGGQECKYLSWRFSHTNPFVVFGYMPKERRDALWQEVKEGKGGTPTTTPDAKVDLSTRDSKSDLPTKAGAPGPSSAPEKI